MAIQSKTVPLSPTSDVAVGFAYQEIDGGGAIFKLIVTPFVTDADGRVHAIPSLARTYTVPDVFADDKRLPVPIILPEKPTPEVVKAAEQRTQRIAAITEANRIKNLLAPIAAEIENAVASLAPATVFGLKSLTLTPIRTADGTNWTATLSGTLTSPDLYAAATANQRVGQALTTIQTMLAITITANAL